MLADIVYKVYQYNRRVLFAGKLIDFFINLHTNNEPIVNESIKLQFSRVFLHKNWRGVRDSELENMSGIKGAIFCHASGFIGGNKTREGALDMAVKSIRAPASDRE